MVQNMTYISSPSNPLIKELVRLQEARERAKSGLFIIEGSKAVKTASDHLALTKLLYTEEHAQEAQAYASQAQLISVSDQVMKKISSALSPSGLLAVCKIPLQPKPEELTPGLVLAQLRDPGNMGTLIRTAAACSVRSVVIIEGADPWGPKVVQASAGTLALVRIFQWNWEMLIKNKKELQLCALVVSGGGSEVLDPHHALIVVGNESRGIPLEWQKQCDALITLPMPGRIESLNAAVAGSIVLYDTFVRHC